MGELWLWVTVLFEHSVGKLTTIFDQTVPTVPGGFPWLLRASQAHSFLPLWEMFLILDEQTILGGSRDFPTFPFWPQPGAACLLLPPGTTGPP